MHTLHRVAAVMLNDIEGYEEVVRINQQTADRQKETYKKISQALVAQHFGTWHNGIENGSVCVFNSSIEALDCAISIQKYINNHTDFKLRVGIHTGEVQFLEGELKGDTISIASLVKGESAPGGVCISENVYKSVNRKQGVSFEPLRIPTNGKGSNDTENAIYQIVTDGLTVKDDSSPFILKWYQALLLAVAAVGIGAAVSF